MQDDVFVLPMSFAQERLWFLSQLDPDSPAYNLAAAVRLTGSLDVEVVRRCVVEIVRRHEALRSTLEMVDGGPAQVVNLEARPHIERRDLSILPEAQREHELGRLIDREAKQPFDLATGPLLRLVLIKVTDVDHVVLWVVHHAVFDGWSTQVVLREFALLYTAFVANRPSPLSELPLQYGDFAHWQRERAAQGMFDEQLGYWKEQLGGEETLLSLPIDRPRPPVQRQRGARFFFHVSERVTRELRELARREDTTLFVVLLSAFKVLLARYAGASDVRVATPVTNRDRAELEALVGCFANTVVLRTDLSGDPPFASLVGRVQRTVRQAQAHQDIPFEQVVDALAPTRDLSRAPLSQVLFALQPEVGSVPAIHGLTTRLLDLDVGGAQFDLTLEVLREAGQLSCAIEYDSDLFDLATIERLSIHYNNVLAAVADAPASRITQIALLEDTERAQLLSWSTGPTRQRLFRSVVQAFVERVECTPQAQAVIEGTAELTYAELDRLSSQLAHRLLREGVGPEDRIGVSLPRSRDMIIAVLAVLKAGAIYVPIDPGYPEERVLSTAEDAALKLLLVAEDAPRAVAERVRVMSLSDERAALAGESSSPLALVPAPLQGAYIIYTSGSTGVPKGVLISHQALSEFVESAQQLYALTPGDRVLQFASLSFDASVEEIFPCLCAGATLVLRSEEMLATPERFLEACHGLGITVLDLPTSYFHRLAFDVAAGLALPARLRLVIIGGETALPERVHGFVAVSAQRVQLVNTYGPTEATVVATACNLTASAGAHVLAVPIGNALPNVETFVLDAQLAPVPVGVVGDVYVGGAGLARGYWARPELTAERFIPHPLASRPGERLYRTGDRARFRANGQLEFAGRSDEQVKIRGFRIELGEIEVRLASHPAVRQAVVRVDSDAEGEGRLVAYVAVHHEVSADELRRALKQSIPDYMVPAAFVVLDELPRTTQGKIDVRALPKPTREARNDGPEPESALESTLLTIWRELLRKDSVRVRDNFFELGGDSILALQVVARAKAAGISITPKDMFQHQTVAELATVAQALSMARACEQEGHGPIPLTPIQRAFFELAGPNPHHFNLSLLLAAGERLNVALLARAWQEVVRHHAAFALRYMGQEDGWVQRPAKPVLAELERCDLSHLASARDAQHTALERVTYDTQASLHLTHGPVVKAVYFDLGTEGERVLLVAHHLVVDAVSFRIVVDDLQRAYRQLEAGRSVELLGTTAPFRSYAERVAACEGGRLASPELTHPESVQRALLVLSDPAGSSLEECTERFEQVLAAELSDDALLALKPYRLRMDELLLVALGQALLHERSGHEILVDVEGHGRDSFDDLDVSRTVGWFTRLDPVELHSCEQTADALSALIKGTKERVRRRARSQASVSGAQVCFNYLGQWEELGGHGALFSLDESVRSVERDGRTRRSHELEVDAALVHGRLRLIWSYSGARLRRDSVAGLAARFEAELKAVVGHCQVPTAGGFTPSDFPLVTLDQRQLDQLVNRNGHRRGDLQDLYPLSPLQQGLLFHTLWEPGSGSYVEQVTCTLQGPLDVHALSGAFERVVEHHEVLRTTFVHEQVEEPVQRVARIANVEFTLEDLTSQPPEEHGSTLAARLAADRSRGFDLECGPLMRVVLFRMTRDVHVVLWSHHHLLLDGWSAALVLRDVFAAYDALRSGHEPRLAHRRPYRDFIAWLHGRDLASAEAYWRRTLHGFDAATQLPLEHPQPRGLSGYGTHTLRLSAAATARLQAFAREQHITLNTLVQAAWALLLSRAARTDDVLFGITVSGRSAPLSGIEQMVGLFINTLPLRVTVSPSAMVAEWLRALAGATADAAAFEYTPLVLTRACSSVPAGRPLFESLLVFENYPIERRHGEELADLKVSQAAFADQTDYPLTLTVLPGDRLELRLAYQERRFCESAAEQLLHLVETGLRRLTTMPSARVGEISLIGERELHDVMGAWHASERSYSAALLVHQLIELQAAQRPDDVAVLFDERRVTFRELNEAANQLAHALRRMGVGPDVLVAVAMERSVELVIALLGTMKAGGAYVPIDPDYPPDRVAFMLEDAGAGVLLSQWPVAARLPAHRAQLLCLDADRALLARESRENPACVVSREHLAYTIYTSGSTGLPKGAGNTHGGLLNRLQWMQEHLKLDASDRVLQKTPFSFDVSVWEFFWPLMVGAGLVMARPGDHRDGERLVELITQRGVTTLHFVPPMLQAFLETEGASRCHGLRRVICSGEALPTEVARRFFELCHAELHNLYGPTEASIDVTYWQCTKDNLSAPVPIGYPIANTQIYLLDRQGHPVPSGVPGELYIGGVGLARGYHERPALTAERFVPDPFAKSPGARLYRTGDLARQRSDGAIEFLGRLDHQIKIRGLRVELGEIEARLLACTGVREAVVVAREEASGAKRLLAYVSASEGAALDGAVLRSSLEAGLPAHMVPAIILVLPRLPLSPNGKVDRKALPSPELLASPEAYVAPRSAAERVLAELWAESLHRERVGIHDDFFALGGDSIITLQIIARASQRGLRLTPKMMFEHPTVAALAAVAQEREVSSAPTNAAPPQPERPDMRLSSEEWADLLEELDR